MEGLLQSGIHLFLFVFFSVSRLPSYLLLGKKNIESHISTAQKSIGIIRFSQSFVILYSFTIKTAPFRFASPFKYNQSSQPQNTNPNHVSLLKQKPIQKPPFNSNRMPSKQMIQPRNYNPAVQNSLTIPLPPKNPLRSPPISSHLIPTASPIFASRLLEIIRQMANFLVSTNNIDQQTRLAQQFCHHDHHFIVPKHGNATLEAIFRAISFEYYQNSPSALAVKIIAFTQSMINSVCSLALLREILQAVKNEEDRLSLMHQYFWEINRELGDKEMPKEALGLSEECSLAEQNDRLFDLASRGELRHTRSLQALDFHQAFQPSMKHYCPQSLSEKTQVPSMNSINPQENKQKLDSSNHFAFHTAQNYYGNQWWKAQKHSDSSKEISKFQCKANNPFSQKSIGRLVLDQFRYDLNRQIQLGKEINKHQEVEGFKYKKMMKDKLLDAKLKKKKKK